MPEFSVLVFRRAARSSVITLRWCAVSQSFKSSSVSTEDLTCAGISTVSDFMDELYHSARV